MTSIFGEIFTADELESAVESTLKIWFRTYLNEIELQHGQPNVNLPPPRSYKHHVEMDTYPEPQLPQCLIVSPGMSSAPLMEGDGTFRGFWRVAIGIVNSAKDRESTNRNSKWYAAAVRAIILQHRSLGGVACGVEWEEEGYEDGPTEADRSLAVSTNTFIFEVPGIADREGGPSEPEPPDPDDLPGSTWPDVQTTDLDVEKLPIVEGGE